MSCNLTISKKYLNTDIINDDDFFMIELILKYKNKKKLSIKKLSNSKNDNIVSSKDKINYSDIDSFKLTIIPINDKMKIITLNNKINISSSSNFFTSNNISINFSYTADLFMECNYFLKL